MKIYDDEDEEIQNFAAKNLNFDEEIRKFGAKKSSRQFRSRLKRHPARLPRYGGDHVITVHKDLFE